MTQITPVLSGSMREYSDWLHIGDHDFQKFPRIYTARMAERFVEECAGQFGSLIVVGRWFDSEVCWSIRNILVGAGFAVEYASILVEIE